MDSQLLRNKEKETEKLSDLRKAVFG